MNAKITPMYTGASVLFTASNPTVICLLLIQLLKMISRPPQTNTVMAALKYGLSLIFLNISLLQEL